MVVVPSTGLSGCAAVFINCSDERGERSREIQRQRLKTRLLILNGPKEKRSVFKDPSRGKDKSVSQRLTYTQSWGGTKAQVQHVQSPGFDAPPQNTKTKPQKNLEHQRALP